MVLEQQGTVLLTALGSMQESCPPELAPCLDGKMGKDKDITDQKPLLCHLWVSPVPGVGHDPAPVGWCFELWVNACGFCKKIIFP